MTLVTLDLDDSTIIALSDLCNDGKQLSQEAVEHLRPYFWRHTCNAELIDRLKSIAEGAKIEADTHNLMRAYIGMSESDLVSCGHRGKTVAQVLELTFKDCLKRCEKVCKAHEKKYPL